ncbi:MAG: VanZ family protein [Rikenellaceae bacterium]
MSRQTVVEGLTLLYVIVVTLLSTIKLSPNVPMADVVGIDKVVHIMFYFVLNMLLLLVFSQRGFIVKYSSVVWVTLCSIGYGCLMEVIQHFTGRQCSVLDIAANSIGAVIALALFRYTFIASCFEQFVRGK